MAPQSGCDKAKLLNFKSVWLRGCKDRESIEILAAWAPGRAIRLTDCDATVMNRRENRYEFGIIAVVRGACGVPGLG
jgi:hypothetical protein